MMMIFVQAKVDESVRQWNYKLEKKDSWVKECHFKCLRHVTQQRSRNREIIDWTVILNMVLNKADLSPLNICYIHQKWREVIWYTRIHYKVESNPWMWGPLLIMTILTLNPMDPDSRWAWKWPIIGEGYSPFGQSIASINVVYLTQRQGSASGWYYFVHRVNLGLCVLICSTLLYKGKFPKKL